MNSQPEFGPSSNLQVFAPRRALQEEVHILLAEKEDFSRDLEREQTASQVVTREMDMLKAEIVKQTPSLVQVRMENSGQKRQISELQVDLKKKLSIDI